MGLFWQAMTVSGLNGGPSVEVEGLVDTGATFSMLPRPTLERMGIRPERVARLRLGDERRVAYDVGRALFTINGTSEVSPVVFGPDDADPILGAVTLEVLLLAVDPVDRRLVPQEWVRM